MDNNPYLTILPFLLVGLALFAVQLAAIYMLLRPFRGDSTGLGIDVPDPEEFLRSLPPAEAGSLAAPGCRPRWSQAFGCLLSMAAAGIVSVELLPPDMRVDRNRVYLLRLSGGTGDRQSYEQGLLEALFLGNEGMDDSVPFAIAASRFPYRSARFTRPLLAVLSRKQLIDPRRENARQYLHLMTAVAGIAGLVASGVALWLAFGTGLWPILLVPSGFLAGALVAAWQAGSLPVSTQAGSMLAEHWLAAAASLAQAGLPDELESPQAGEQLAYLAALGQLRVWLDQLRPGALHSLPAWFHARRDAGGSFGDLLEFLAAACEMDGRETASHTTVAVSE